MNSTPVRSKIGLLLTFAFTCASPHLAQAQGLLFPAGGRPERIQPFYIKDQRVRTQIRDSVAETTVEQTFVNSSSVEQEGTYLFPLPEGATPTAFSMTVGDRTMEPRVLRNNEARAIYESIVRQRRDPALLEYAGRDLVRMSVFPIPPRGERVIKMRYTEILKPENGLRKYAYTLSTSRFGAKPVGNSTVSIDLRTTSALKNVFSPSHDVSIRRTEDKTATVSWEGMNDLSDRDLQLYYSTSDDDIGLSLVTHRMGEDGGYFMLLASPRVTIPRNRVLPKQIVFVLDRTGSMAGEKIRQARRSLVFCLNSLHPEDRFNVITFNEAPDHFSRTLEPATEANVKRAVKFVEEVDASGGTNIDEALRAGMKLLNQERGKQKMLVFMTDGLPTVGETNVETILQHVRQQNEGGEPVAHLGPKVARNAPAPKGASMARVFSFGVGYDVNVPFLDKLGQQNKGDSDFVKPSENIEVKVSSFFSKVTSPILMNLQLAFEGAEIFDVYPKTYPDLFKGSQLVVIGRYRGHGRGMVRLSGLANETNETFKLASNFGGSDNRASYLPRVWAMRKIGYLVDQVRLSNQPEGNKELIDEIIRLSREFGIITEYTSFLVDENEGRRLGLRDENGDLKPQFGIRAMTGIREEVLSRAKQGVNGADVTNQSFRAKSYNSLDKAVARSQAQGDFRYYNGSEVAPSLQGGGGFGGRLGTGLRVDRYKEHLGGNRGAQGQDRGGRAGAQAVASKTFYLQKNSLWQDNDYDAKKHKLYRIQAFSDAHFALLRAVPKLGEYSSVGDEVIVRIGKNAIQIGKEGQEKLTSAELKEIASR
jgi:Ca-activated chloride channel family protein